MNTGSHETVAALAWVYAQLNDWDKTGPVSLKRLVERAKAARGGK